MTEHRYLQLERLLFVKCRTARIVFLEQKYLSRRCSIAQIFLFYFFHIAFPPREQHWQY